MLTIRDSQLKQLRNSAFALRVPGQAREIYEELAAIHFLPAEAYDGFRAAIEADVRQAYQFGIDRRDGFIQFVSYRFSIGESWYDDPKFRQILERPIEESEKWKQIADLLGDD